MRSQVSMSDVKLENKEESENEEKTDTEEGKCA